MTVLFALCAAMAFGASVALQERAASGVSRDYALRLGLLTRVARRPVWLAGLAASGLGLVLQIAALRHGSLVVVLPVMTTTLIFALAFVAIRTRVGLHPGEWLSVSAVMAGLVVFLALAQPDAYSAESPHVFAWWVTGTGAVVTVGGLAALSTRRHGRRRAALLGLATGISNAFVAVLTKAFSQALRHGGPLYDHWTMWALIAAGVPAVLLVQSVYQSGNLHMSLPIVAVVEPVLACLAGIVLFGEHIIFDGIETFGIVSAMFIAAVGLWHLAGNPRITLNGVTARRGPDSHVSPRDTVTPSLPSHTRSNGRPGDRTRSAVGVLRSGPSRDRGADR
ncbi:MAG: DMT family transporter [Actinomycetota bacterium]